MARIEYDNRTQELSLEQERMLNERDLIAPADTHAESMGDVYIVSGGHSWVDIDEALDGGKYLSFAPQDQTVFVELVNGKIDLSVLLDNIDDLPELDAVAAVWGSKSASIEPHFTVASPVDFLIDSRRVSFDKVDKIYIDASAKPLFDALKAEMLEQIQRLEALEFEATERCIGEGK